MAVNVDAFVQSIQSTYLACSVAAQITISCNKWKSVTIFIFLISKIVYNSDRSADTSGIVLQNLRQEAFLSFLQSLMGANFFKGDRIIPDIAKNFFLSAVSSL